MSIGSNYKYILLFSTIINIMAGVWEYLVSYFIYTKTGMFILSFMFLYVLFFAALTSIGIFDNNSNMKKVKAILSIAISTIALYVPSTQEYIFRIVPRMVNVILIFFALIVIIYMGGKVVIHSSVKDEMEIKKRYKKIQKYLIYTFLVLGVIAGIYIIHDVPLFENYFLWNIGQYVKTIIAIAIVGGILYYLILHPIISDAKEKNKKKKIEAINEALVKNKTNELKEEMKIIEEMGDSDEIKALLMRELLKRHKHDD